MDCHNGNNDKLHGSYQDNKKRIMDGLKRIEGQMRGIQRMVEEERYCVDVLNQIAASRMALSRLAVIILQDHTMGCVSKAVRDQKNEEGIIEELMEVVKRFI